MEWVNLKIAGLKNHLILKFMKEFGSASELLKDKNIKILEKEIRNKIIQASKIELDSFYEKLNKNNISLLQYTDGEYPDYLKNIQDPPLFLYIKGNIKFSDRNIAVVGTRRNTIYGKVSCETILKELLRYDTVIVSGLALGIDNIAHSYTLKKGGRCIGVVGSGLDVIFPYESRELWGKIPENGMLISEYPLGTEPLKWNFPRRNRIIAGLCQGLLICESHGRGGALITAELAFQNDREVFAIPGFINYPSFRGCNELIKSNKAKLVISAEDITEEFSWEKQKLNAEKLLLSIEEHRILIALKEEKGLDDLITELGENASFILSVLMGLKIRGLIYEISGGRYKAMK